MVKMVNYFARIISYLLHPMLMPLYILFFLFNGNTMFAFVPVHTKIYCYLITTLSLVVMPLVSLPFFRYFRLIRDYGLNGRQERVYPVLIAVLFGFIGFWLLGKVAYTSVVQQLFLVVIILLSLFSMITLRWKISMHMTAIGGVCGFLLICNSKYLGDMQGSFVLMILLAGMLASSRLYLKKHDPAQIYSGFLLGLFFVFGILF